ncbi:protein ANTAGONIST OF LIKE HETEROCHROMATIN PROTEIN 1 isoform X2 [Solenopsis invicta]|uniref:protein ANTAGONIST OF LIKE HETEROCHROMATIN PROTEIN 1 isoform X2 n=1 Tax=Solenopsis invicta TaxID=13686 RepID=UPI000595DCA3|nr:protein ANTAGONIST OF LIKE HETEROCHROMATIN PROTEIN 1 isoform X2 [Solenopsis invicta]
MLPTVYKYQNNMQKLFLILQNRRRKLAQRLWHIIFDITNTYLLAFGQIIAMQSLRQPPRMWMKARSSDFWERIVLTEYLDEDWLETFRMEKFVFLYICDKLQNRLQPAVPFLIAREAISVQKAVAVTIFYLASCCEYRVIGNLFGIHKTSVWRCVHKVVKAINDILQPIWIKMPNEFECTMTAQVYEERTHIPQLIGAIDGTHIPVLPPADGYKDFINRKGWPSIILQGVVDHTLRFKNINCRAPGSAHDAAVFKESNFFTYYKHLIPQKTVTLNNVEIPFMIMGDPAYPLLPWLLKGYTRCRRLTPEEESFNVYLNTGRVDIELAFGRLKARWRRILKRIDTHFTFAPQVVAACCVLHNIVEFHKQAFKYAWMRDIGEFNVLFPQPEGTMSHEYDDLNASNIRNTLMNHLSQFPLRRSFR